MKKRWIEKAVLLLSLAGALFLFAFFLKDNLIPLFTLQLKNDVEGAKAADLQGHRGRSGSIAD